MSNESFADAATSAHAERLRAPKSLHGVEDVEVIWDTITRRFPNAAPLLCEMETVIERAEDLLQQLKTPSNHDNGTRSSPSLSSPPPPPLSLSISLSLSLSLSVCVCLAPRSRTSFRSQGGGSPP
jgi:hypothetical protein